jgi:hypothetical protein
MHRLAKSGKAISGDPGQNSGRFHEIPGHRLQQISKILAPK